MREHGDRAETAEVEVEVGMDRHEVADIDAGRLAAFVQPVRRIEAGRIVVARDIEAAQGRGQIEGGEMVGREPGDHRQRGQHGFEREHGLDAFAGGEDVGGFAEAHAVAEQMAERPARIGKRGLAPDGSGSSQVRRMPVIVPSRSVTAASSAGKTWRGASSASR